MSFWEMIVTAISGGAIGVFVREVVGAYLNVINGKSAIKKQEAKDIREAERQDRQDEDARNDAYIAQLRQDYGELKNELKSLKKECDDRDKMNGDRITALEKKNSTAEKTLARAEERITQYEDKLREMKIKFRPWNDPSKPHTPIGGTDDSVS